MSQEIELKLALDTSAPTMLDAHPELADCERETLTLGNRYYDTPDGDLEAAKVALRVRQSGNRRLQTLKTAAASQGGLSSRGEWEWSLDGRDCNAAGLDIAGLRELGLPALEGIDLDRLAPVFSTDFERRLWRYREAESSGEIEIALDQGEITVGDRCLSILELELELKAGEPSSLWALTHRLCEGETPLAARPANHSKASRAAALRSGWPAPDIPSAPSLDDVIDAVDCWQDSEEPRWLISAVERIEALREDTPHKDDTLRAAFDHIAEALAAGHIPWQASAWLILRRDR
ncbi:CYTH domain-containing protein [Salinicola aestuarinus]|uniref:CYTH domain-containing protein n=1 Tax=Salinicola aestuarinus TaxID=1949082 RepID=UPI001300B387|nr:CYTH domain-containing protein [Salinicola aestuarinus]